jgi:hypothetical protein
VTFVAKIRAAGAGAIRSPLFEWMGEEHPYSFRSQMAKVEHGEVRRIPIPRTPVNTGMNRFFLTLRTYSTNMLNR